MEAKKEDESAARARGYSSTLLAESNVIQMISDFREQEAERNFYNLFGDDVPYIVQPSRLGMRNGRFVEVQPDGSIRPARGSYIFIVQNNELFVKQANYKTQNQRGYISHIDLANGESVQYAGEITFGGGKNARGVMRRWTNNSGHYQPSANMAHRVGLPFHKFVPVGTR